MSDQFPKDFLWGSATAAYQVEGGNWASDWWEFEHQPGSPVAEPSGDACDHYHRYAEDLDLLAGLGLKAFRFSLEWSRVEPEEGEFSQVGLDHYRRVAEACLARGITPVVTMNHMSLPRWVARKGGWLWPELPQAFARFCSLAAGRLADLLSWVVTINEPNLTSLFVGGGMFPRLDTLDLHGDAAVQRAYEVASAAHRAGRQAVQAAAPHAKVGLALAVTEWTFDGTFDELNAHPLVRMWEGPFFEVARDGDFIGVQSYTRNILPAAEEFQRSLEKLGMRALFGGTSETVRRTAMGYEFRPQALGAAVRRSHRLTGLPVLVTENGVAADDDAERVEYIQGALEGLLACLADGLPVRGYLHWSLLDNFEWNRGYEMRFGLVSVDRKTFARTAKPSARFLGEIARRNGLA